MWYGYTVVNLGFSFKYCDKIYNTVSISVYVYICFGVVPACEQGIRPSPYDILVGLNYGLNPTIPGSGQIYYEILGSGSVDFKAFTYVNILNPTFVHKNILIVTYDSVLLTTNSDSRVSFQIFLLTDSIKSYVIFKFTSCPSGLTLRALSGLTFNYNGRLKTLIIPNYQHCISSNVGQTGVWVTEVTSYSLGKYFLLLGEFYYNNFIEKRFYFFLVCKENKNNLSFMD